MNKKSFSFLVMLCFLFIFISSTYAAPKLVIDWFYLYDQRSNAQANVQPIEGGYKITATATASADASASAYLPWEWYAESYHDAYIGWDMGLRLEGEKGESAEILADWDLSAIYTLLAEPSGVYPSGTQAVASTDVYYYVYGIYPFGSGHPADVVADTIHEGRQVTWWSYYGGELTQSGSSSLGPILVNNTPSSIFTGGGLMVGGDIHVDAFANLEPHGYATAWNLSNFSMEIKISESNPVPEPTTMLLLGSGLIGLAGYGRKKFFKK